MILIESIVFKSFSMQEKVITVDPKKTNAQFNAQYVGCVVLTKNNKILLQQRSKHCASYPGYLCEFGGKVEEGESPKDTLIRELHEEIGAKVNLENVVSFGAITESMSQYRELIYVYFWRDALGSITGCYEGEARYFDSASEVLKLPRITDGLRWLLAQCQNASLID